VIHSNCDKFLVRMWVNIWELIVLVNGFKI
jgi:hypothetical protein